MIISQTASSPAGKKPGWQTNFGARDNNLTSDRITVFILFEVFSAKHSFFGSEYLSNCNHSVCAVRIPIGKAIKGVIDITKFIRR